MPVFGVNTPFLGDLRNNVCFSCPHLCPQGWDTGFLAQAQFCLQSLENKGISVSDPEFLDFCHWGQGGDKRTCVLFYLTKREASICFLFVCFLRGQKSTMKRPVVMSGL